MKSTLLSLIQDLTGPFIILFLEGKGGRKRKRNINVWLPLAHPGLQPDCRELNLRPFGSQASFQCTEPPARVGLVVS